MSVKKLVTVGALLLLTAGGCKAADDGIASAQTAGPQATSAPTPDEDNAVKMRKYMTCMKEHGVIIAGPDATSRPPAADPQTLQNATTACRSLLPSGGDLVNESTEDLERRRRTAQCMRASGYAQWPDPVPGVGTFMLPKDFDADSPEVKAALDRCAKEAFHTSTSPSA